MRGYARPLGWNLAYTAPRTTIRRYRYPFNPYPSTLSDPWEGSWAQTDILCPDGATLTNDYTVKLVDGVGNNVEFNFRSDGQPADAGKTLVVFAGADTADQVRDAWAAAINTVIPPLEYDLAEGAIAATVTVRALYKSSRGNFTFQPGAGGLLAQQYDAAGVNGLLFAPDPATYIPGDEGALAVPARMGYQRMMPTRKIPVTGQGEPVPEG